MADSNNNKTAPVDRKTPKDTKILKNTKCPVDTKTPTVCPDMLRREFDKISGRELFNDQKWGRDSCKANGCPFCCGCASSVWYCPSCYLKRWGTILEFEKLSGDTKLEKCMEGKELQALEGEEGWAEIGEKDEDWVEVVVSAGTDKEIDDGTRAWRKEARQTKKGKVRSRVGKHNFPADLIRDFVHQEVSPKLNICRWTHPSPCINSPSQSPPSPSREEQQDT